MNQGQERLKRLNRSKSNRQNLKTEESLTNVQHIQSLFGPRPSENNQFLKLFKSGTEPIIKEGATKPPSEIPIIRISPPRKSYIQKGKEFIYMNGESPRRRFVRTLNEQLSKKFLELSPYKIHDSISFSTIMKDLHIPDIEIKEMEKVHHEHAKSLNTPKLYDWSSKHKKKEYLPLHSNRSQELSSMLDSSISNRPYLFTTPNQEEKEKSLPNIKKHVKNISAGSSIPMKSLPLIEESSNILQSSTILRLSKRTKSNILGNNSRILTDDIINRVYENNTLLTPEKKIERSFRVKRVNKLLLNKIAKNGETDRISNKNPESLVKIKDCLAFLTAQPQKYHIKEDRNKLDDFYNIYKSHGTGDKKILNMKERNQR